MVADPNELGAGDNLGEFRIVRRLGVGGMGVVYLAKDERLGRNVALKVIAPQLAHDPEFQRRFEAEARNAAAIDDHHVVPIYSAGSADGRLYIAMRFVDGTDLRTVLGESAPLDTRATTAIVGNVASALDAAHAAGLVHRDVKPANILLTGEPGAGTAYLTDFGLTKGLHGGGTALTGTGLVIGTVDYMAPEQWTSGRVDARTDVYALGCVLHEMLAGSVPFPGSDAQKMWGHVNEPLPALADGDPHPFDPVVERATAKEPDDRFPSASDLARAARAAAQGTRNTTAERSVATGAAASGLAESDPSANPTRTLRSPTPPPAPPPAQPATAQMQAPRGSRPGGGEHGRGLGAGAVIGAAVLVAAGLVAAALVVSGGKDGGSPEGGRAVASSNPVGSGEKAEAPSEEPETAPVVDDEASSSSAEETTAYFQDSYAVEIPAGWLQEADDADEGVYDESVWRDPGDSNTSILIDDQPAPPQSPLESAEQVRSETGQSSDYREVSFESTSLSGRPAARWVFEIEDDRRVDYFFNDCGLGIAVLGSTSPANFGSMAETFHEAADSVSVPCGE